MELRHIRYFVAVAEELHFRRAAERLNVSQPPLSQQIRQLEEELGVALFVRNRRGVSLTPAGRRFLPRARRILSDVDIALLLTKRDSAQTFTVGFVSSATSLMAPILRNFRGAHPEIDLRLVEGSTSQQGDMLRSGEINVGFLRPPVPGRGINIEILVQERLALILANDHPLAGRPQLKLADMARERFVLFPRPLGPGLFDSIIVACRKAGFSPEIDQIGDSMLTILGLVAAGQGVSLVPASLKRDASGVVFHQPNDLEETTALAAAYSVERLGSPFIRTFIDSVREMQTWREIASSS